MAQSRRDILKSLLTRIVFYGLMATLLFVDGSFTAIDIKLNRQ